MKKIKSVLVILLCAVLVGCNQHNNRNESASMKNDYMYSAQKENIEFFKEKFGLSEEELKGIDLTRLMDDYQIRTRDYSADDIRDILESQREAYMDDGVSRIYSVLNLDGRALSADDEIACIAIYINSGTNVNQLVIDLNASEFFFNTAEPRTLTKAQEDQLKQLPFKWEITEWEQITEESEEFTTGNYRWKLVFGLANGEIASYGGYTQNMTHFPAGYKEFIGEIETILTMEMDPK